MMDVYKYNKAGVLNPDFNPDLKTYYKTTVRPTKHLIDRKTGRRIPQGAIESVYTATSDMIVGYNVSDEKFYIKIIGTGKYIDFVFVLGYNGNIRTGWGVPKATPYALHEH